MRRPALAFPWLVASLALSLSLASCVPAPFALPPVKASIGGAVRYGSPRNATTGPGVFHVDVGAYPLGLLREWQKRRADVGIGYAYEGGAGSMLHMAYLDGIVFPFVEDVPRAGLHLQPRLIVDDATGRASFGFATRMAYEGRWFADKPFSNSSSKGVAAGIAYGEGGIGLYFEGAYATLNDKPTVTLGMGLSVRIPALVGVAIVPIK